MPTHSTTPKFHDPSIPATSEMLRTAKCGHVIPEDYNPLAVGRVKHEIWTSATVSRREDVASNDDGMALKLLYSRLCPDWFPWTRDPDFIASLEGDDGRECMCDQECVGMAACGHLCCS